MHDRDTAVGNVIFMGEHDHRIVLFRRCSGDAHDLASKLGIASKRQPVGRTHRLPAAVRVVE